VWGLDFEAVLPSPEILHEAPWSYDSRVSDGLAVLGVTLPGPPETGVAAASYQHYPPVETLQGILELQGPGLRKVGITTTEALKTWLLDRNPNCVALAEAAIAKVRATGYRYLND